MLMTTVPVRIIEKNTDLPNAAHGLLFHGLPFAWHGKKYEKVERTEKQKIPHIHIGDYMYIVQNMDKDSEWAKMARAGTQILWIIQEPSNNYVGRMVDGVLTRL